MTLEKHSVQVKYLDEEPKFVLRSLLKPLPDLGTALDRARFVGRGINRRVSLRVVSEAGIIKITINADGEGRTTKRRGAV